MPRNEDKDNRPIQIVGQQVRGQSPRYGLDYSWLVGLNKSSSEKSGASFSKTQIPKFSDDPIFYLQPAPSPVWRERAGERVALRVVRI